MLQTSVEMVKPGGTGRPAFVISARPDPLPPSKSFIVRLPSALPLPKKYRYFFNFAAGVRRLPAARFASAFLDLNGRSVMILAMSSSHRCRQSVVRLDAREHRSYPGAVAVCLGA